MGALQHKFFAAATRLTIFSLSKAHKDKICRARRSAKTTHPRATVERGRRRRRTRRRSRGLAQALAEYARNEATRETLASELEAALDDADALRDALRRRDPPPRPAVDRRSVSAPVEAVASLEADLDALRRDVASLRPHPASRPGGVWLLAAAVGLALTAWILTPPEDPYAAALTS